MRGKSSEQLSSRACFFFFLFFFCSAEVNPLKRRVLTLKWPAPLATYFLISEYLRSIFYISNFPLRAREKAAHLPTFSAGPIIANLLFALVYHSI